MRSGAEGEWRGTVLGTTRTLSPEARMQHLRAEVFPAMAWGAAARHLRPDVADVAEKVAVRMTNTILRLFVRRENLGGGPAHPHESLC